MSSFGVYTENIPSACYPQRWGW